MLVILKMGAIRERESSRGKIGQDGSRFNQDSVGQDEFFSWSGTGDDTGRE